MTETVASDGYRRERTGAAGQVLNDLRGQILSGRLPKGTKLPSEKELAASYEVSAPTIREAIRALSAMSLVEARHGSGTYVIAEAGALMSSAMSAVVELENIDLSNIFDLLEALYLKVVELAVREAGDAELADLRRRAGAFSDTMGDQEFAAALDSFLSGLIALSGNRLLITIAEYLLDRQISLAQRAAEHEPSVWQRIAGPLKAERIAIADALVARDLPAAEQALRVYMKRGDELVQRYAPQS